MDVFYLYLLPRSAICQGNFPAASAAFFLPHNLIIRPCRDKVADSIKNQKNRRHAHADPVNLRRVKQIQRIEQMDRHVYAAGRVEDSCRHRQSKHQKDLPADRRADVLVTHPYLLHDMEAVLIFKAFGNLFVIHDQHNAYREEQSKKDADKQKSSVQHAHFSGILYAVSVIALRRSAG